MIGYRCFECDCVLGDDEGCHLAVQGFTSAMAVTICSRCAHEYGERMALWLNKCQGVPLINTFAHRLYLTEELAHG